MSLCRLWSSVGCVRTNELRSVDGVVSMPIIVPYIEQLNIVCIGSNIESNGHRVTPFENPVI